LEHVPWDGYEPLCNIPGKQWVVRNKAAGLRSYSFRSSGPRSFRAIEGQGLHLHGGHSVLIDLKNRKSSIIEMIVHNEATHVLERQDIDHFVVVDWREKFSVGIIGSAWLR